MCIRDRSMQRRIAVSLARARRRRRSSSRLSRRRFTPACGLRSEGMGAESTTRKFIAVVGEIEHGKTKKFTLRRGQRDLDALLVNFEGNHFAYINRCPHTGITLDWVNLSLIHISEPT